jgi:hypothetical protein
MLCLAALAGGAASVAAAHETRGALVAPPPVPKPRPCLSPTPNLSGVWYSDDDRGYYFIRQIGSRLWWAGLSWRPPQWDPHQLGLLFTNVFQGSVNADVVSGDWADVPRGTVLGQGQLSLAVDRTHYLHCGALRELRLVRTSSVGSPFGAHTFRYFSPNLALPFDTRSAFRQAQRNDEGTMASHMSGGIAPVLCDAFGCRVNPACKSGPPCGLRQDVAVLMARIATAPSVNFPPRPVGSARPDRSYESFMCADDPPPFKWFNGGIGTDPPDGDVNFDVDISPFPGWYDNSAAEPLAGRGGIVHNELIMYGRTADRSHCVQGVGAPSVLPGWADTGSRSVLLNGRPIDGERDETVVIERQGARCVEGEGCQRGDCAPGILEDEHWHCDILAIRGERLAVGTDVRVTGALAQDEHAGTIELHPVYSIDVIRPTWGRANITGTWAGDDEGTYFVREARDDSGRDAVWWLGLSSDRGRTFANVFRGHLERSGRGFAISGDWADIPLGSARGFGALALGGSLGGARIERMTVSRGFGGSSWRKLYDPRDRSWPQSRLDFAPRLTKCSLLRLSARDRGSGVQFLAYRAFRVGTGPPPWRVAVGSSLRFSVHHRPGRYRVEYHAVDNVGNREPLRARRITVIAATGGDCATTRP